MPDFRINFEYNNNNIMQEAHMRVFLCGTMCIKYAGRKEQGVECALALIG
jgi:hypothetical protein